MPLSQRELELTRRAQRAGAPVNMAALRRKFNFTVSPTTTVGVDASILIRLGARISELTQKEKFRCELSGVVLFPIILDTGTRARKNFVTHKRASNGYFVGRNIDFLKWDDADPRERLKIASETFLQSLLAINDRHLAKTSKDHLRRMILIATRELGRSLRTSKPRKA